MRMNLTVTLLALISGALLLGCGGSDAEMKDTVVAPPPLPTVAASLASAKHVGAAGAMMPVMELTGSLPGPGYVAQVKETREGNVITLKVMAVPGAGAVKGEPQPFTQKHTLKNLGPGKWIVRVIDHRGVEIGHKEFKY